MKVTINRNRSAVVIDRLLSLYEAKAFPYASKRATLPQRSIPEVLRCDPLTLSRYFFYLCLYMRGGIESHTVFKGMTSLHAENPELLMPEVAARMSEEEIGKILLKHLGGWDLKTVSRYWRENSELLLAWGGNPLALFHKAKSYGDLLTRIRRKSSKRERALFDHRDGGFLGFQYKMTSMLAYFYIDSGLVPEMHFPPPVDFHHCRLLLATRCVTVEREKEAIRYEEYLLEPIRKMFLWYCKKRKRSALRVADALWLYSLVLCAAAPGNRMREPDKERPAKESKEDPQYAFLLDGAVSSASKIRSETSRYLRTCGKCALRKECSFYIPARPYYRQGEFALIPAETYRPEWAPILP